MYVCVCVCVCVWCGWQSATNFIPQIIEKEREMGLSVSYSVSRYSKSTLRFDDTVCYCSGSSSYGDGMDPEEAERALTYKRKTHTQAAPETAGI